MNTKRKKTGRKLLSFLLTLAMLVGLMPGMSMTAYAATSHGITINTAQHGTVTASVGGSTVTSAEESATVTLTANPESGYRLKSISGVYKDYYNESMGIGSSTTGSSANFSFSAEQCNNNGCRLYQGKKITISSSTKTITRVVFTVSGNGISRNESQLVTSSGTKTVSGTGAGSTITISNLSTNSVSLTGNGSNSAQQWQCNRVVVYGQDISDTTLKVNNTSDPNIRTFTMPAVVQGNVTITAEFEEMPKYKVTLTGGANATTSGGNTTQTELTGAMETVTYTANSGYKFPETSDYYKTTNGITVTRTSDTIVTVSGTPTANADVTVPDAVHAHSFTSYSASGATITATCTADGCTLPEVESKHTATLTIATPTSLSYDGTAKAAVITDANSIKGDATIQYQTKSGDTYGTATTTTPTDAGDYKASITVGGATASVEYTIAKAPETAPSANTEHLNINYPAETISAEDGYEVAGDGSGTAISDVYFSTILGNPAPTVYIRKTASDANHDPSAWVAVTLAARPDAPTAPATENATNDSTADGKIKSALATWEYKNKETGKEPTNWTAMAAGDVSVKSGTYQIRVKATDNAPHGAETEVTVGSKQIILSDAQKPTAKTGLTYNGSEQALINAPAANLPEGATEMRYAIGTDATTVPTDGWNTSIPTKTNAGTYYVWYKAVGDKDHSDSESKCVTSKIRAAISKKVTFKVVNGSWNNGKKDDVTVNLRSYEGDTLKLSANQIPAVGNKPDNNYKAGSWNVKPAAGTAITKDTTYTYTYVKKASAKTKPAPAAKKKKTTSKKVNRILSLKGTQTGSKITTTWTRIPDASMYKVYGAYCGKKMKLLKTIKRNTTTKATFTKLNGKKLNLKKNYKFQVIAYKKVNGKTKKIAKSLCVHFIGRKNAKYTNVKAVKVTKKSYSLKKGKAAKIKARIVLANKKKKAVPVSHAPRFRYVSSNKAVATVSRSGKITAKKAGTCTIYVYAANGCCQKVKVTVKQ